VRAVAIIKMQKVKAGKAYGLKAIIDYIQNSDKTEKGLLISAKDCLLECSYKQMLLVKHDHLQDSGRQYVHIIQSFSIDDKLTGETAHEIGQKLLKNFEGFQGIVATHTDRNHIHNHIVLNSVNWRTGLKWQQSKKDLQELKDLSDKLCKEYGLSVIEKGKGWQSYGERKASVEGRGWKRQLAESVAECIKKSTSRQEFIHNLYRFKIEVVFNSNSLLFILPEGKKCGSDKLNTYGDFSRRNLHDYFKYNNERVNDGISDPMVMYYAVELAEKLLGCGENELRDKWIKHSELSALEGQALKEAIIQYKKGSGANWDGQQKNNNNSKQQTYLLITINELLDMKHRERFQQETERAYGSEFVNGIESCEDEDEYEL